MGNLSEHLPIINLVVSLLTIAVVIARWSQKGESSVEIVSQKLANCRTQCDLRLANLDTVYHNVENYTHNGLHGLRNDLQNVLLREESVYARKDMVTKEYTSLRELMESRFDAIDQRLEKIERNGKEHDV